MPERTEDSQIAKILADVYESDAAGGRQALEEAIRRHPDLADELRAHAEMLDLVEEAFDDPAAPALGIPDEIGGYRILEVIGRGGMATVYRALQEEPFRQEVAIKVLQQRIIGVQALARFDMERESLALMDHPNISRVLAAGVDTDGTPYVVVELVDGVPITDYCETRGLDLKARLRLFATVCEAVQHAHQKGVIHRDIKPSNVLVTEIGGNPIPKVIDFGLAKARGEGAAGDAGDADLTAAGQVLGTPAYMSPEQAIGADVDARTDVYGLGMLLYELLVGDVAWDRASLSRENFVHFVKRLAEEEPPRPSTRLSTLHGEGHDVATPRSWERELRGDLDWIVMKALAKERDRRYATPQAFADDVARFLAHEPVAAGPPSASYRIRKFIRRHRTTAAASAVVFATLVVGLIVSLVLYEDAVSARTSATKSERAATAARGNAEELAAFMLFELRNGLIEVGRLDLMRGAAEKALVYYETSADRMAPDSLEYRHAVALQNIGDVFAEQGHIDKALQAFESCGRVLDRLLTRNPGDRWVRRFQAGNEKQIAQALIRKGDFPAAASRSRQTLALLTALIQEDPTDIKARRDQAEVHSFLGQAAQRQGDPAAALDYYRADLELRKALKSDDPKDAYGLLMAYAHVGTLQHHRGDLDRALENLGQASRICQELTAQHPDNTRWQRDTARMLRGIGEVQRDRGELEAASNHLEQSNAAFQKLVDRDPTNAQWRRDLASGLTIAGSVLVAQGRPQEAVLKHKASLRLLENLATEHPELFGTQRRLALAHMYIGSALTMSGDLPGALQRLTEALARTRALVERRPGDNELLGLLVVMESNIANLHLEKQDWPQAAEHAKGGLAAANTLASSRPEPPPMRAKRARLHLRLGLALMGQETLDAALRSIHEGMGIAEGLISEQPADLRWRALLAQCTLRTGEVLHHQRDYDASLRTLGTARVALEKLVRAVPTNQDWRRFLKFARTLIDAAELLGGSRTPASTTDNLTLAYARHDQGRFVEAAEQFRLALADEKIRNDLANFHTYNAACSAALAAANSEGDVATKWRDHALEWLKTDLATRAAALKAMPASQERQRAEAELHAHRNRVRTDDPELASLRSLAGFEALLQELPRAKNAEAK